MSQYFSHSLLKTNSTQILSTKERPKEFQNPLKKSRASESNKMTEFAFYHPFSSFT
jgi:hypothetical protein